MVGQAHLEGQRRCVALDRLASKSEQQTRADRLPVPAGIDGNGRDVPVVDREHDASVAHDLASDLGNQASWKRLETTYTVDQPQKLTTLHLGDSVTRPGAWGRAVRFGGIQFGTNFNTQPGFIRFPSLSALKAFESVARTLSFTKSARELGVTQAAVSRQVKALEEELAVQLVSRQPKGNFLTDAGEILFSGLYQASSGEYGWGSVIAQRKATRTIGSGSGPRSKPRHVARPSSRQ